MAKLKKTAFELELQEFQEGRALHAYRFLGSHPAAQDGQPGYRFRVWAPNAVSVSLMGNFNDWDPENCQMQHIEGGIWEVFQP